MVVKKHRLMRNAKGETVDDPRDKGEGWPIYCIRQHQLSRWQQQNTSLPERAMLVIAEKEVVYFFEQQTLSDPFSVTAYHHSLKPLYHQPQKDNGKIRKNSRNAAFLFSLTRQLTAAANRPDYFTAEYIFAQKFTQHYDEFANYFPEFGRLKVLSGMTRLIFALNNFRRHNEANIEYCQKLLDTQHETMTAAFAQSIKTLFIDFVKEIDKKEIPALSHLRKQSGLNLTVKSKPVLDECKKIHKKAKAAYIKEHGLLSRFDKACPTLPDIISQQGPEVITRLTHQNGEQLKGSIRQRYDELLQRDWITSAQIECCLNALVDDNNPVPLAYVLIVAKKEHDTEIAQCQQALDIATTHGEWLAALLDHQATLSTLVNRIRQRRQHHFLVQAWSQREASEREALREVLDKFQQISQSLEATGLGPEKQEQELEGVCPWVPAVASMNGGRFVYGGVAIILSDAVVRDIEPVDQEAQTIVHKTRHHERIIRVSAEDLAANVAQTKARIPTNQPATNVAQQYRFYQAEQQQARQAATQTTTASNPNRLFNRRNAQTRRHAAAGSASGNTASGGAAAAAGGSSGGNGGGRPPGGWTVKARLKAAQLPCEGRVRFVPRKNYLASMPLPKGVKGGYLDKFGNEWRKGPSRTSGEPFEWDVQLSELGRKKLGWASRDGEHVNVSLKGHITHR